MFSRFRKWNDRRREWRRTHDAAWAPATASTPDGLTAFIHAAKDQLLARFSGLDFEIGGQSELFLRASIPGTSAELYLHRDGAQIHDGPNELYYAEDYDYLTPQDLLDEVVAKLGELHPEAPTA